MEIRILGHNMKVDAPLEEYARKKLERLDHYLPNIADVRVELSQEHTRYGDNLSVAQITLRHERGAILRAQESLQGDSEAALNAALDKIHRQIERFKGKRSRKGREKFTATLEEVNAAEIIPGSELANEATDTDELNAVIVRRKDVSVIPMNEDEAIQQMELLGHTFFMFMNSDTNSINVIYKRRIGGYGVLVPQLG